MLFVGLLFTLQSTYAQTYYVDASRPDDSGNGLTPGTAKKTIQAAVNVASVSATVLIYPGTYDERVVINKALIIDGLDKTQVNATYTGTAITTNGNGIPAIFTVASPNVTIKNITFTVDLVKIHSAIHSYGNVSGIVITDNNFVAVATGALPSGKLAYGRRNAVSINIDPYASDPDYSNVSGGITGVTIQRNTVNGLIGGNAANGGFRAGFQVDRAKNVLIGGDTPADGNVAQTINHDVISRFFVDGDVTVKNNTLNGGGLEMSSTNNAGGTVTIESNTFNGAASNTYTSQARFQGNTNNKAFVLKNNTFTNTKWGLSIENFKNITIEGNSFTPSVNDFRLITVNTKRLLSLDDGIPDALNLTIRSNTFNGLNPVPALGKAIAFYNHKQDATNNYLNSNIVIGGVGVQNIFNADIPTYIYVDNNNGNATGTGTSPNIVAMAGYPEYGGNITITTTGYWTKNIRVDENQFYIDAQLRKPFDMTQLQRNELDGKIYDKKDDANIGEVQYYFPVTNVTTGLKYATIQSAIDAASAGDEINTLPGEYLENVNIDKQNLKLIGPGATLATIKGVKGVSGGTTVALAQTGVVLEGFTVTRDGNNTTDWNGALNNQGVSMNADNTIARKLLITGNRNGMYINNRKNVLVENCDITNNRTGVQLANDVSGTIVRNNNITNNWTMGVLYMDPSNPIGGFGQTADLDVVKNNITGNWYSQIEFRTDNVNVLNFGANYLGAGPITVSNVTSGEPGYAAQIPTAFGGSAIAPGSPNPYKICGVHSDKVDYSVALADYTDNDIAIGFQPDSTIIWVYEASPVATLSPKLTSASKIVAPNGTIVIKDATITSGGEITKDVTLDADATSVTINGDLTVNTTALTLAKATIIGNGSAFILTKGKINTNSTIQLDAEKFYLNSSNPAADYINGKIIVNNFSMGSITFPVGKGTKSSLVSLVRISGDNASVFEIEYFPSAYTNTTSFDPDEIGAIYDKEYWSINRTNGDVEVRIGLTILDFSASGFSSLAVGDAMVVMFDGSSWSSLGNTDRSVNDNKGYIMGYASASSGIFTLAKSPSVVLPITLLSFTANATTGGALVKWSTAKEENNAKFEIEKSFDGKNFFVIDSRKGQGNSTTVSSYEFLDLSFKQSAYYRLVQVDAGGKKTAYTDLTKFVKGLDNSLSVVAYPNPVTTKLYVTVGSANKENVRLLLTDLTGKTLKVKNADSTQPIELDVAGVATGSYILQVIKDSGNVSKKILKL